MLLLLRLPPMQATDDLKACHQAQMASFVEELQRKRPSKPRHSRDYLQHREVQDKLAKAKLYGRATKVRAARRQA